MPSGRIQQRIDPKLQREAELILKTQGIKPSQAIYLFYMEIRRFGGLPFQPTPVQPAEIPNDRLRKALRDADRGIGVKTYKDEKDLFDSLRKL